MSARVPGCHARCRRQYAFLAVGHDEEARQDTFSRHGRRRRACHARAGAESRRHAGFASYFRHYDDASYYADTDGHVIMRTHA